MAAPRKPSWLQQVLMEQREALLALAALILFSILLALAQYVQLDRRFSQDLQTNARIVADTAAAAVLFDNAEDAREILAALRSSEDIQQALLLDKARLVLAAYTRSRDEGVGLFFQWAGVDRVRVPVVAGGEEVGELLLHASRVRLWQDLARFVGTSLALLVSALGLAWLASRELRARMRDAARRMQYLALHDALTDLPNRESLRLALEDAAELARDRGQPSALLFIDLDNFKQINDDHGHAAGDQVLRAVAQRLRELLRPGDLAARLAGDEFALLLCSPVDVALATRTAARLVQCLAQPVEDVLGESLRVRVSVGVALLPLHASGAEEAMQLADSAMYQAKRQGKDGYQLFTQELGESLRARHRLELDLSEALRHGDLQLAYQPLFDVQGRIQAFEGLARWRHAQRGAVSPAEFVPVAEAGGLIDEMGLCLLQTLARDRQHWLSQGQVCPPVALNLSSRQCRRPQQRERFLATLETLGLGPEAVEFELTEGALFEDLGSEESMVSLLQKRGYVLAIDDFGTGYSSLSYLRRLRCRKLKIDRVFVNEVARHRDAQTLVGAIAGVAHAMHMQVVAEGVENEADHDCLAALGCDLLQGFGLSRPLTPQQALALLRLQQAGERARVQAQQAWYETPPPA
jgi:diguanylate cyclase (GGDEF)-like protein